MKAMNKGVRVGLLFLGVALILEGIGVGAYVVLGRYCQTYRATGECLIQQRPCSCDYPDGSCPYVEPKVKMAQMVSEWRSEKVWSDVIRRYRCNCPASTVSDDVLLKVMNDSEISFVSKRRVIEINVYSENLMLAVSLANAYVEAIEKHDEERRRLACEKALCQIRANVEHTSRKVSKLREDWLNRRTAGKTNDVAFVELEKDIKCLSERLKQMMLDENVALVAVEQHQERVVSGRPVPIPRQKICRWKR